MKLADATTSNEYETARHQAGLRDDEPEPNADGRVPGDGISRASAPDVAAPATVLDVDTARIVAGSGVPLGPRAVLALLARLDAVEKSLADCVVTLGAAQDRVGALYEAVDLTRSDAEGQPVQYVGVYCLRWQRAWGEPTVGFREASEGYSADDAADQGELDRLAREMMTPDLPAVTA